MSKENRGMGSIFSRPGTSRLYIQYSVNGKVCRESCGSASQEAAAKLLKSRLSQVSTGKFSPNAEKVRMSEIFDDLESEYARNRPKSLASIRSIIGKADPTRSLPAGHLRRFFDLFKASKVGTTQINAYIDSRLAEHAAPGKINVELAYLRRAFRLALEATPPKLHTMPKIKLLKVSNTRTGFFERESLERLLPHLPPHLVGPTQFAYFTGMRKEEILRLQWSQVDWLGGVVVLNPGTTKNNAGRQIPLNASLRAVLEMQRGKSSEWIFPRPDGKKILPTTLCKQWDRACEKAGLQGYIFHDLRRTGVRNLIRAGVPQTVAMAISGHKSDAVFRRYDIVDPRDLKKAMEAVEKSHCASSVYSGGGKPVQVTDPQPLPLTGHRANDLIQPTHRDKES
jgi:integrase